MVAGIGEGPSAAPAGRAADKVAGIAAWVAARKREPLAAAPDGSSDLVRPEVPEAVGAARTVVGPALAVPVAPAEVVAPEGPAEVCIGAEAALEAQEAPAEVVAPEGPAEVCIGAEAALEAQEAPAEVVAPEVQPVGAERPGAASDLQVEAPAVAARQSGPGERHRQ